MSTREVMRGAATRVEAAVRHPAIWILGSWGTTQLSLLVSGPLVVRLLGVERRGELAFVFAILLLCAQVGLLGLPAAVIYVSSSQRVRVAPLLARVRGTVVAQTAAASAVGLVTVLLFGLLGRGLVAPYAESILIGLGVGAVMLSTLFLSGLQGEQRFRGFSLLRPLPAVLYTFALAVLLSRGTRSLPVVLALYLTGWLLLAVLAAALLRRPVPGLRTTAGSPEEEPRAFLSFARRAALATAAPTDQLNIDQLLVGLALGHGPLGLYVIGIAFESVTLIPLVSLSMFVGPRVAAAPVDRRPTEARRWILIGWGVSLLILALVEISLGTVLPLAFGRGAGGALTAARILAVAGVLLGQRRLRNTVLQSLDAPGRSTWVEALSLGTMVTGVTVLALVGGLVGACVGVLVTGVVSNVVLTYALRRVVREKAQPAADQLTSPKEDASAPSEPRR